MSDYYVLYSQVLLCQEIDSEQTKHGSYHLGIQSGRKMTLAKYLNQ